MKPTHKLIPLTLAYLTLAGCLDACVSSSSYDDLERKNQLLRLENDNLRYELDGLQRDHEKAKRELAAAEKLAAKRNRVARDCQDELNAAQARVSQIETALAALQSRIVPSQTPVAH